MVHFRPEPGLSEYAYIMLTESCPQEVERPTVQIFVPLSGRAAAWRSHVRPWLDAQTWPSERCRLVLADTSQSPDFGRIVRTWLDASRYRSAARYYTQTVGPPALAEAPRPLDGGSPVNDAMRAIYSRMASEMEAPFVLVVEDDHRPPPDAIARLLVSMRDPLVAAVSGLYRERSSGRGNYVAWPLWDEGEIGAAEDPPIAVGGTGFGTLLLRRACLLGETFARRPDDPLPYDIAFAARIRKQGWIWLLDRSMHVAHAGAPDGFPPASSDSIRKRKIARASECPHRSRRNWHARCLAGKGGIDPHFVVTADDCAACPNRGVA